MKNLTIEMILTIPHSMDHVKDENTGEVFTMFRFDNGIEELEGNKYFLVEIEKGRVIIGQGKTRIQMIESAEKNYVKIEY